MQLGVKVISIIQETATVRTAPVQASLESARATLVADLTNAFVVLAAGATFELDLRVVAVLRDPGGPQLEVYPKVSVTLSDEASQPTMLVHLRTARDTIHDWLASLGLAEGWTIVRYHQKLYGGA